MPRALIQRELQNCVSLIRSVLEISYKRRSPRILTTHWRIRLSHRHGQAWVTTRRRKRKPSELSIYRRVFPASSVCGSKGTTTKPSTKEARQLSFIEHCGTFFRITSTTHFVWPQRRRIAGKDKKLSRQ